MTSFGKLKCLYNTKRYTRVPMVHHSSQMPLHQVANNRLPASVAAILQWTLPFCIALCSVDLFGSVVEHGLDFDDDGG